MRFHASSKKRASVCVGNVCTSNRVCVCVCFFALFISTKFKLVACEYVRFLQVVLNFYLRGTSHVLYCAIPLARKRQNNED